MTRIALATMVLMLLPAVSFSQTKKSFPIYDNGGFPDLVIDSRRLVSSLDVVTRTFSAGACELAEGSIGAAGTRRLLRFDVAIVNRGDGDLIVGDPTDPVNPYAEEFQFSGCHEHYHIAGFTDYQLRNLDGTLAAFGHKQAFCLEDLVRYGTTGASHGYTCGNQGITSGWADLYSKYLSGQWVDITGVADGDYILHVEINAADTFNEGSNSAENVFEVGIRLPATRRKK